MPIKLDYTTPTAVVQIQGVKRTLIIDAGSCYSIWQSDVADEPIGCTDFTPFGVTGKNLKVQVEQTIKFLMGSVTFSHAFVGYKLPTNAVGILGIHSLLPKVKCTLVQALRLCTGRTAHRESRGIALLFHDHGTRRG